MSEGSGLFSNQYIVVQDRLIMGKSGGKTAKQNSEPGEIKIVDGTTSFLAKQQLETLNDLDQETFLRHSEIQDTVYLRLDYLRDFKNCLKLLSN